MYESITRQLYTLADQLERVEDCASLPLDEIVRIAGEMLDNIGLDKNVLYRSMQEMIDDAVGNSSIVELKSAIRMLALLIETEDKATAYGALAESYKDVVVRRMPEYNYLKNRERLIKYYEHHERKMHDPFMGKGCVYTVLTGGYDDVLPPVFVDPLMDYIVFTDTPGLIADGWEVRMIDNHEGLDAAFLSRLPKILPYSFLEGYDYALYIDANIQITGDVRELLRLYSSGEPMLCLNHHINADIYEEAELCIENGKGDPVQIKKQVEQYENEGFPHDYGLTQNNFMLRNLHDERLRKVMQDWWEELNHYSKRDQLSLTYCCWKNDFMYDTCPISIADNPYFEIHGHKK